MSVKVGVAGGSGYTGVELIKILLGHPEVEIVFVTSEKKTGQPISSVFPPLKDIFDLKLIPLARGLEQKCDLVFVALPHKTAMSVVPSFLKNSGRVVDLSADYRLKDISVYEKWYSTRHSSPELCEKAVYGLPELNIEKIKTASLIANPGCYSTSVILALAPVLKEKLIDLDSIIADSKSGISGAGKQDGSFYSLAERGDSLVSYSIANHRHMPEIEQELSILSGAKIQLTFTPQLAPMVRGILSNIYAGLNQSTDVEDIIKLYNSFYRDKPFVRIMEEGVYADTKNVRGSNYCDISLHLDKRNKRIIISSAIDNLVKGASGQATQNMNLMLGFKEQTGLRSSPFYP